MPIKQINENTAITTLVTTAETVVITSGPYVYDNPNAYVGGEHAGAGQGVSISGIVNLTPGTASTAATIRVRQGSIAGPIVAGAGATIVANVAAAVPIELAYEFEDLTRYPAQAGGGVYVLTVQMTAATGNSSIQPATMEVAGA